jgi:hypothetical protein
MYYLLYIRIDINERYFIKTLQNIIENKLIKEINVYNLSKENNNELYIYNFIYENYDRHPNIDANSSTYAIDSMDSIYSTNSINSTDSIDSTDSTDAYIKNILIIIEKYVKIFFPEFNNKWKINYNLIKQ